jgi:hypothetical protein
MPLSGRFAALVAGLSLSLLAACAPVPTHAPKPPASSEAEGAAAEAPAAAEPTAPPGEPTEGQPLAPVDERTMTCGALSAASDDDKAYAASFLLGYRSALIHAHAIDTKQIEAIEIAALADCASTPNALASKVFGVELVKAVALTRIGAGTAPRPPYPPYRTTHRPGLPAQATPGQMAPEPTPTEQTEPNQAPPMQYAPAQTTPAQAAPPQEPPTEAAPAPPTPTPAPAPAAASPPAPSAPPPSPPDASPPAPSAPPAAAPSETPPSESPQK